jgi:hypothetical protein
MERQVMDKAEAVEHPYGTGVAFSIGDPAGMLRGLDLLEQTGMSPVVEPQEVVQTVRLEGRDVGGMRTEPVCGDDALAVRLSLAPLGPKALGGMAFASILGRSIIGVQRLRHERQNSPLVRREARGAQHLMRLGDGPMAVHPMSTRGTVHGLGRKRLCAIKSPEGMAIKKRQRFPGLATLALAQEALEHRAEPLGGDGVKDVAHGCVAWDPCHAVDGVQIALSALLVKSQERGRLEGKHGKGGHECLGQGNRDIAQTVRGKAGKTAVPQAQERIGGERLTDMWRNDGHGTPCHENIPLCKAGVFSPLGLRKASASDTVITGLRGSAGIAVLRIAELKQQLDMRLPREQFSLDELRAVVGLLAGSGVVWQLDFGGLRAAAARAH